MAKKKRGGVFGADLPEMPENPPMVAVSGPVNLTLMLDTERFCNGSLLMRFADTHVEIESGEEVIGAVGMSIGGTLYFQFGKRMWKADLLKLFKDAMEAERVQYLDGEPAR